jgi:integrase
MIVSWDTHLGYAGILAAVKRMGEEFDVKLRPHDLRRSFAGILEKQGVPITDISRAMRHEDVGTTSRYLERDPAKTVAVTAGFRLGG